MLGVPSYSATHTLELGECYFSATALCMCNKLLFASDSEVSCFLPAAMKP